MNRLMTTACASLALLAAAPLFGGELRVAPDRLSPHAALQTIRAAKKDFRLKDGYDGTWFQPCQVLLVGDIVQDP